MDLLQFRNLMAGYNNWAFCSGCERYKSCCEPAKEVLAGDLAFQILVTPIAFVIGILRFGWDRFIAILLKKIA